MIGGVDVVDLRMLFDRSTAGKESLVIYVKIVNRRVATYRNEQALRVGRPAPRLNTLTCVIRGRAGPKQILPRRAGAREQQSLRGECRRFRDVHNQALPPILWVLQIDGRTTPWSQGALSSGLFSELAARPQIRGGQTYIAGLRRILFGRDAVTNATVFAVAVLIARPLRHFTQPPHVQTQYCALRKL